MRADTQPFRGSVEVAAGRLTRHELEHDYVRVHRDVYLTKQVEITAKERALAAAIYAGPDAVLTGRSAAALYGVRWIDSTAAAEVVRPSHFRSPDGLVVRRYRVRPDETLHRGGIRLTTEARTGFDLGRLLPRDQAIVLVDALCNTTGLWPADIAEIAGRHPGERGVARLRRILDEVDGGAESPPETRTRLLLVAAGLPRPETQVTISNERGFFVARVDLGWRQQRVAVEYDGAHHWTDRRQRSRDIDRQAELERLGWRVVRVSAELLADRPGELVRRVRAALGEGALVRRNAESRAAQPPPQLCSETRTARVPGSSASKTCGTSPG